MKTNDIKKGMVIQLDNGWYGIMADNMRGNTRMVSVDGFYREIGSVYSHDITTAWPEFILEINEAVEPLGAYKEVDYTPAQLKLKERVLNSGF